jgi:predicted DNA-binding transcriptional regulator AlpA
MSQDVLNTPEAAQYVRLSKPTLERLRLHGDGPRYAKLAGAVRYRKADLDAWIESRLIRSTSEYHTKLDGRERSERLTANSDNTTPQ